MLNEAAGAGHGRFHGFRKIHRAGARLRSIGAVAGLARGPSAVLARAPPEGAARRPGRVGGGAHSCRRRRSRRGAPRNGNAAEEAAARRGFRGRAALHRARDGARLRRGGEAGQQGGRQFRDRRAHVAGAGDREERGGAHPQGCERHAAIAQHGDRRPAQGPHRRQRIGRAGLRRAQEIFARSHRDGTVGQARPGDRARRGDPPHHPGAVAADQEQSGADRRAGRRQDGDRRGPGAAHRQRRRAREPQGQAASRPRHGRAHRRRQVSRRVRGAAQGGAVGDPGSGGRYRSVHRRDAYAGRRRQGRGRHGRIEPAQAGAGARRASLRRGHDARRIPQERREGRGLGAALPADLRERADGRGHDLDPARHQGEVRASPRRPHHRFGDRRVGPPVAPLHHRPFPARQGHRPHRRGGGAPQDASRTRSQRSSTNSTGASSS